MSDLIILTTEQSDWVVDEEETKDHWLEINDGEGWWSAVVKWDGCVDLRRYHNHPWGETPEDGFGEGMEDYIHICDVDDFIERLQSLKAAALKHFDGCWPG